jgi:tRNA 2-selenouridine synthase
MIKSIEADRFLELARFQPVVDVRSPNEYAQGHIPESVNIPLFNNEERAIIGILYKNSGREAAVIKGLDIVGPKMSEFVKKVHSITKEKDVLVHCWRGGMRSENMAWLFSQAGYTVSVLKGGYKAYRKYIRSSFSNPAKIFILGGLTGSGKTDVLHALENHHEQILDLEKISCHKGSVFGSFGQKIQPTNEQFENEIYSTWSQFDFTRHVWIEDESRAIGNVNIPEPLFDQITHPALMIRIECAREMRVNRLVKEYSQFDKEELRGALVKIGEKLGDRIKTANLALNESDYKAVADIVLNYYDKSYEHSFSRRPGLNIHTIPVLNDDPETTALIIRGYINSLEMS